MGKELKNKPLVEAILEVRWGLQGNAHGPQNDPNYKILLGRLFDRVSQDYPTHEALPTSQIPEEIVANVVHHRFRVAPDAWPVIQVGPGIFTLNAASDYKWEDFLPRAVTAVKRFYEAYPRIDDLKIVHLALRYIDAVDFDCSTDSALVFLQDRLKVGVTLPESLFHNTGVENEPRSFVSQYAFKCEAPRGLISIRFADGLKNNQPVLLWETTVESTGDDVPKMPDSFEVWLEAAHKITGDWFFKMIEGELERRFSDE